MGEGPRKTPRFHGQPRVSRPRVLAPFSQVGFTALASQQPVLFRVISLRQEPRGGEAFPPDQFG